MGSECNRSAEIYVTLRYYMQVHMLQFFLTLSWDFYLQYIIGSVGPFPCVNVLNHFCSSQWLLHLVQGSFAVDIAQCCNGEKRSGQREITK